jgi:hypothetical protein
MRNIVELFKKLLTKKGGKGKVDGIHEVETSATPTSCEHLMLLKPLRFMSQKLVAELIQIVIKYQP